MRAVSSWNGQGVAAVLEHDRDALLERAVSGRNLADLVYAGLDDEQTRNLCKTAKLSAFSCTITARRNALFEKLVR
ncbi:aminoglycoside/hydroxyurea antibiotic resistance kinase [Acetobacter malorum]|uniref:Aminoglycoside/hydroxyurea antibiotic resistance kinase n=1 Tax=Acetobacter malorum TaxID=178901 RepID=A0A177G613_9PROT|nr:aminoglycoside/hydroxyurea antibiotic resistance kinase [Acetobacter malorum]